ncbi:selenocysteine insertion sequence-binding protein 2 [Teleopsis dalmanni]|uniref:selenocysteine insertion sequence-binding protein 2 n=1 Tax=Teleopsis dalmanni TaxID=139649 RepID=UPI0018CFE7E4|nr:selenocysteine insertion sequence-binding protein 2 [Teleopsis dalmanni]
MKDQTKTDKLKLIDAQTFERLLEQDEKTNKKRIKNPKFVKTRCEFNLLHYLKPPKLSRAERKLKFRKVTTRKYNIPFKQRGKVPEGGPKKSISRLKKYILLQRKLRKELLEQQDKKNENLDELIEGVENLNLLPAKPLPNTSTLHSRSFRSYCDNCTTPQLGKLTDNLLRQLNKFQRQKFAQNEIKARAHRRFVVGFREAQNYIRINKVKLLVIAPDCEQIPGEGGLDDMINSLKMQCQSQQVPYVFSLKRRELAYTLYKKVPVSCVAILDYDGAREIFTELLNALKEARQLYVEKETTIDEEK